MVELRAGRRLCIPDAVEGAVEVRLELADQLQEHGPQLGRAILLTVVAVSVAALSTLPQFLAWMGWGVDLLQGTVGADVTWMLVAVIQVALALLIWAFSGTVLLFLVQVRRFLAHVRARYGTLERMGREGPPSERAAEEVEGPDRERLPTDPARALMGLAREAEGQLPQLDRLFRYSVALTLLLAGFLALQISLEVVDVTPLPQDWALLATAIQGLALALVVAGLVLMMGVQGLIRYFLVRHRALEAFEAEGPAPVPEGETPLERYIAHLASRGEVEAGVASPTRVRGASGEERAFDAALPGLRGRVLVKVLPGTPGLDDVRGLREAAEDVARADRALPRRVVALVDPASGEVDVEDEVYAYVLDNPIEDEVGERSRSVQIVLEDEGHYAELPFTAPEA